jgi:hypothetical protein
MFIGESLETRSHYPGIDLMTVVCLIPAFAYVVGMFLALKWERAGAKLAGASLAVVAIIVAFFAPHDGSRPAGIGAAIVGLAESVHFLVSPSFSRQSVLRSA